MIALACRCDMLKLRRIAPPLLSALMLPFRLGSALMIIAIFTDADIMPLTG